MCVSCYIAKCYSNKLLPRRIAHSLFYRSARISRSYLSHHVRQSVNIGDKRFLLDLPLEFQQNWTILFEAFNNPTDGLALRFFNLYASNSKYIFDIGMNAGLYLYHAAAVCPRGAMVF